MDIHAQATVDPIVLFKKIQHKYRRWRARRFLKKLRRMLLDLEWRLRQAKFTRHDRRRFKKDLIRDYGDLLEKIKGY